MQKKTPREGALYKLCQKMKQGGAEETMSHSAPPVERIVHYLVSGRPGGLTEVCIYELSFRRIPEMPVRHATAAKPQNTVETGLIRAKATASSTKPLAQSTGPTTSFLRNQQITPVRNRPVPGTASMASSIVRTMPPAPFVVGPVGEVGPTGSISVLLMVA